MAISGALAASRTGRRVTVLVLVLTLSGCTSATAGEGTWRNSPTGGSSSSSNDQAVEGRLDLNAGLLPAAEFGPGAVADPISVEDFSGAELSGFPEGTVVTPAECEDGGADPQPDPELFAGQAVQIPGEAIYFQLLQSPFVGTGWDPAVADDHFADCPTGTATFPDGRVVTLSFGVAQVPTIGDANTTLVLETTLTNPDGASAQSIMLTAYVADADRVLVLSLLIPGPGADRQLADFEALVQAAFDYQHGVLG